MYSFGDDFASRWKLFISIDTELGLDILEMALGAGREPEVLQCDKGFSFASTIGATRLQVEATSRADSKSQHGLV